MQVRFPRPLAAGDVIGVTSPSSGVPQRLRPRLERALEVVQEAGFEVRVGSCMDGTAPVSAPAQDRAAELEQMLVDPQVRAVIPPWGGELAVDLVPLLNWSAIAAAEPTWFVGYSDISTLLTPLTLVSGWATIHGQNLMDTPYRVTTGLRGWLDIVQMPAGRTFVQTPPAAHRRTHVDYVEHPDVAEYDLDTPGSWVRLDDPGVDLDVVGRLVGGCIETLSSLAGTRYLDTRPLATSGDGLIVYVEAAGDDAASVCRRLHGMRLNGFFDGASAVLVGRTYAPSYSNLSQHDAALDALGGLGVPIVADVECGHWAPHLPLVNGALCRVELTPASARVTQTLG